MRSSIAIALVAASVVAQPAQAQEWTADLVPIDSMAAPTPFGPGEHLVYGVKLGIFNAGQGHLTVEGINFVRGRPTYRAVMGMDAGNLFFRVEDTYTSWFDLYTLQSWRFVRD
jgi:hypothetical protein